MIIRSSLTEETPATPGWVDDQIAAIFAPLGDIAIPARDVYAACLAGVRGAVDVEAGHDRCRRRLLSDLGKNEALKAGGADVGALDRALQALEAEITAST
jgi:hypothetical protein